MATKPDEDPCVLVISKDTVLRKSLTRMLALRGFRTVEAADEDEATDGGRRAPPCLILVDLSCSPFDDLTSARRIRGRVALRDTPLLIVSAENVRPPETRSEGYIAEVFDFEQLLFLINRLTPAHQSVTAPPEPS